MLSVTSKQMSLPLSTLAHSDGHCLALGIHLQLEILDYPSVATVTFFLDNSINAENTTQ